MLTLVQSCSFGKMQKNDPPLAGASVDSTLKGVKSEAPLPILNLRKSGLKNLSLRAGITFDMPELSAAASADMRIASGDSISLVITGPLGISFGRLFATPDRFSFYNMMESVLFEGTPSSENLRKAAKMNISYGDLVSLIRAEQAGSPNDYILQKNYSGSGRLFKNILPDSTAEFLLTDSKMMRIDQYQRKNISNETVLNVFYKDYKEIDGFSMPTTIVIKFAKGTITISDIEYAINPAYDKPFSFKIPKSAKIIRMD